MGKPTLDSAGIATEKELNDLCDTFGAFEVAEKTTMTPWIEKTRGELLNEVRKTKRELRHLESALQILEVNLAALGRPGSAQAIVKSYLPVEGWSLTMVDNYATLLDNLDAYDRKSRLNRLNDYTKGAIQNNTVYGSSARPGDKLMQNVRDFLTDRRLIDS